MTVTDIKIGSYLKFSYTNESGVTTTIDKKDGDIVTLVTKENKYTGRIADINKNDLNLDVSEQYKSNIVSIKYSEIDKIV